MTEAIKTSTTKTTVIKNSRSDTIFNVVVYILLGAVLLVVAYPLYFIIIASISDPTLVVNGKVFLYPKSITFDGFRKILEERSIWTGYANTIFYTVVATFLNVLFTMMVAYPMANRSFSGRRWIMTFFMITMYFGGGMIPTYMLIKKMNLINSRAVMIVLGMVSVYNIIVARSFIESTIAGELEDAAAIDGCSPITFFFVMVLPLSKAIIAVLVLYYGIGHWNDFMKGLLYLNDPDKYPLQLNLRSILIQSELAVGLADLDDPTAMEQRVKQAEAIKYGVMIVSSLPLLILYPFLQKYFVQGVMIGSVKG